MPKEEDGADFYVKCHNSVTAILFRIKVSL